ncbi:MAG: glycosyltransferase family 2 protein [Acidimicrobiales bacterium]
MPTRNRSRTLRQTLHSVLGQQDVELAVVVVDDASTDETPEMVHNLSGIRLIRHDRPTEQRIARNHGASTASTPWVAFCDDDDLWAPTKLRRQLDTAAASGATWCTASALHVDEELAPIGGERLSDPQDLTRHLLHRNIVPGGGSGVLVQRALFDQVGGFDDSARFVEDWDLWNRLFQHGRVACVDELLVAYRQWSRSFSHDAFEAQYAAFRALTNRFGGDESIEHEKPQRSSAFEVRQRLRSEGRISVGKDLPRLIHRNPADTIPMLLMLGLPNPLLTEVRLRRLGKDEVKKADTWLAPYRLSVNDPSVSFP